MASCFRRLQCSDVLGCLLGLRGLLFLFQGDAVGLCFCWIFLVSEYPTVSSLALCLSASPSASVFEVPAHLDKRSKADQDEQLAQCITTAAGFENLRHYGRYQQDMTDLHCRTIDTSKNAHEPDC